MPEDEITADETTSQPSDEPSTSPEETEPTETSEEPIVETPPVAEATPAQQIDYRSPYAGQPQASDMPAEYAQVFDPAVYSAIEKMANDIADRKVNMALQAQAQQNAAARQLGLPDTLVSEYGEAMQRYGNQVPPELRGTKQGALVAFNIALTEKMMAGEDVGKVLQSAAAHFGGAKATAVAQEREVIPPDQRMTSPRTTTSVRSAPEKNEGPHSYLRRAWGMTDEELRAVREEGEALVASGRSR